MKPDRRVRRTRQSLHEALLALTVERGYDAVTVQDVLDRADVARSTFYAHFRDKDDLLLNGFQAMREALPGNLFASPPARGSAGPLPPGGRERRSGLLGEHSDDACPTDLGLTLFRHVEDNKVLARVFMSADAGRIAVNHLRNLLVVDTRAWVHEHAALPDDLDAEWVVQHLVGALFGLLTWWVDHDFSCPADQMAAAYQRLAVAGLGGLLAPAVPSAPRCGNDDPYG